MDRLAPRPDAPAAPLPNFLIVGAQKAGTTWLAASLGAHPDAFVCPEKELYFFTREYERGIDWYARHFRDGAEFALRGEATPGYLSDPRAPERIHACLEDVKLIASLRHPVDRAYSAFWHHLTKGRLARGSRFSEALESDAFEIRSRGRYAEALERYFALFSSDALHVVVFEEMVARPEASLRECCRFLGVDPDAPFPALGIRNRGGPSASVATSLVERARASLPSALRRAVLRNRRSRSAARAAKALLVRSSRLAPGRRRHALGLDERDRLAAEYYADDMAACERILERPIAAWRTGSPASPP